jgi:hypothetical protein
MSTPSIENATAAANAEASTDELPSSPPTPIKVHRQNGQMGIPPALALPPAAVEAAPPPPPPMTHTHDDLNARFEQANPANGPTPDAKPAPTHPPELRRPVLTASTGATNHLDPSRNLEAALSAADDRADLKRVASPSSPSPDAKRRLPTRAFKMAMSDL